MTDCVCIFAQERKLEMRERKANLWMLLGKGYLGCIRWQYLVQIFHSRRLVAKVILIDIRRQGQLPFLGGCLRLPWLTLALNLCD